MTTYVVGRYSAAYDDAMRPRIVPEPGDVAKIHESPDGRELDAFRRRLAEGGCILADDSVKVEGAWSRYPIEDAFQVLASPDGWYVRDRFDRCCSWWPSDAAQAEILASANPRATTRRLCLDHPHRGTWYT
jgi:hypothetical protein